MPLTVARHALPDPLAMAARLPLQPRRDGLSKAQYRAVVAAIALAHVGAIWAILQVPAVRASVLEAAPIFVDLLAPPAPPAPPPPPPPPQMKPVVKPPEPRLITTAPAPQEPPPQFVAPPAPEVPPAQAPMVPQVPLAVAAPPAPPAPLPQQTPQISVSELRYLVPPRLVYPPLSRRNKEYGETLLQVEVDAQGHPVQVLVGKSSGYPLLDQAAVAAMRGAKFKPHVINGVPVAARGEIPLAFDPP